MRTVEAKLDVYFAVLACLCGLTFSGVADLEAIPFVAIFFALFGLVFVDLLKWFSLPPAMAYVALAGIAFYTLNRFVPSSASSSEPQMTAVAELLVYVQAVLMLQRKNRRIYEQLAVFALLELIVAAIFNNALSYGLLLLPLSVVALGALSLLYVYTTSEEAFSKRTLADSSVLVSSSESRGSYVTAASILPQAGLFTVAPATLLVAFVFFYALPRTNQDSKPGIGGKPQVGYSGEVSLGQIGKMMLNADIAVKIETTDRRSRARYDVVSDFYLRGAVLETYNPDRIDGTWRKASDAAADPMMGPRQLPAPPFEPGVNKQLASDDVAVRISVSPMKSDSLFSLPPYHFDASGADVVHLSDRWVIARGKNSSTARESQISYRFATRAFRNGVQSRFLPRFSQQRLSVSVEPAEPSLSELAPAPVGSAAPPTSPTTDATVTTSNPDQPPWLAEISQQEAMLFAESQRVEHKMSADNYVEACLTYDVDMVPSAERLAESIVLQTVRNRSDPVEIARSLEGYLASNVDYRYSLDLTSPLVVGMDPIEQFLSVDRSGNCQYFASALVLMLRSQGIPARLVVGFNTDEYNNIGGYYIARQLHAHAWVEALVDAKWLKPNELTYSTIASEQYWMHLDPTPGGGGSYVSAGGRVSNVFDLAQDIWTSYVVEADAGDRRRESGIGTNGMSGSYELFYERMKLKVSRIRAGELGAGALAGREFSWRSALSGIAVFLAAVIAYQWGVRRWLMGDKEGNETERVAKPSIVFFAEAMALLERLGIFRRPGQTPQEYMTKAAFTLDRADSAPLRGPLEELTSAFYRERFGAGSQEGSAETAEDQTQRVQLALDRIRQRVEDNPRLEGLAP